LKRTQRDFWHPAKWKWLIVVVLLFLGFFLWRGYPGITAPKPKFLPAENLAPIWNGSYPKLVVRWATEPSKPLRFKASVASPWLTHLHNEPLDQAEVDLHSGEFILRQTDFFVPDAWPVTLVRTYHSWDYGSHAFGLGTSHPYDIAPVGTRNPYTYLDLILEDGRAVHFKRISEGTGYADAVYEHNETSSEFYGARITWNGNGWDLRFHNGDLYLFPEAYHAKNLTQGSAFEIRDATGRLIQLKRDDSLNLTTIISSSGRNINFSYDAAARVVKAEDDAGNIRHYTYDSTSHLTHVSDDAHILYRFEYLPVLNWDGYDKYLLTSIADATGREILRNTYVNGRVSEQRLANGKIYRFKYRVEENEIVETTFESPDDKTRIFHFYHGMLVPD
jgi:YD repeat-containing protein